MKKPSLYLLLYIIVLQVLDLATTYLAIGYGAFELNPILRMLLVNPLLAACFKLVIAATVFLYVKRTRDLKIMVMYSIIMIYVIINNLFITLYASVS